MKFPSLKTLSRIHDADHKEMRRIGKLSRAKLIETCPAAFERDRASYRTHKTYVLRMEALDAAARTYGVESAQSTNGEYVEYLNTGETYADTIIYWRGNYRVQSFGDFVETMERQGIRFD